jgi:hypothetical protein
MRNDPDENPFDVAYRKSSSRSCRGGLNYDGNQRMDAPKCDSIMTMSRILLSFVLFLGSAVVVTAVEVQTALNALKAVPPGNGERLARIDGCDGTPTPERWHFLIYDPQTENGYREYVVADGQVVAEREVSQFGSEFQSTDIIGNTFRIDSDRVARLALRYAAANNLSVASMNYEMRRGSLAGPVWEITCFDRDSRPVGWLLVNADDESVLARTGFSKSPVSNQESFSNERPAPKPRVKAKNAQVSSPVAAKPEAPERPAEIRRAEPVEPPPQSRKSFRLFSDLFKPDDD